jgi:hypothetical protein
MNNFKNMTITKKQTLLKNIRAEKATEKTTEKTPKTPQHLVDICTLLAKHQLVL